MSASPGSPSPRQYAGTWSSVVGPAKAAELALLTEPLSAVDAERFGLVARVVPVADVVAEAQAIATRLAGLAPRALALTKHALDRAWSRDLSTALDDEAYLQGLAGATADHAEGIAAFVGKRPPRFTGE